MGANGESLSGHRPKKAAVETRKATRSGLRRAVHRHKGLSRKGVQERLFTMAFRSLVYPQIWEDPVIDLEALDLGPGHRLVTIASGGCNVLSYLIADPERITAVDLNRAHVALTKLKLCAARELPDFETYYRFFGAADAKENLAAYKRFIKPALDDTSRAYWESRDLLGRRRVRFFSRRFYRYGLLGTFIGTGHLIARLHGRNPRRLLEARTMAEQRAAYEELIAPLFDKPLVRWLTRRPSALYGLGIPPSQYDALKGSGPGGMARVLEERLERLACDFPLADNYFAWQAFGRSYAAEPDKGPVPPYLERGNFDAVRARADRVKVEHMSYTEYLVGQPDASLDRYVLLDAQDWMNDADLTGLWSEITRTARQGARVIFRTAGEETILPGRVPDQILSRWHYEAERSSALGKRDRSSIYGAFHLYQLKDGG